MSATFVPSTWPHAPRSPRVFGRRLAADAAHGNQPSLQWSLRRNCSLTPQQLSSAFLFLCAVSALIAAVFFWQGAPFVAAFAGLELLAVGVAMWVFARHAGDRETLTLVGGSLFIEQCVGSRVEQVRLPTDWLRVEPAAGQGSLVQISGSGHTVRVGRHLRPELRGAFAQELRQSLRQSPGRGESQNDSN
jgi:uncharacterized membrane protein